MIDKKEKRIMKALGRKAKAYARLIRRSANSYMRRVNVAEREIGYEIQPSCGFVVFPSTKAQPE